MLSMQEPTLESILIDTFVDMRRRLLPWPRELISVVEVEQVRKKPVKSVLLVESDAVMAVTILGMFDHQGTYSFALTHVSSIGDAETSLASHAVDVVLLDMGLPDAPGLAGLRRIRAIAPRASVVLLSGEGDAPATIDALLAGAQDYLIKGQIEPHELMRAMRSSVARKLIEETLFLERNRAQVTLDCIGDAVICTDNAGNITFLNPIAERMTGWSHIDAAGQPLARIFRIMDASTGELAADPTTKVVAKGRTDHLPANCILTRRDGHQVFIEDSVAPIRNSEGKVDGSVLVFRDVTIACALAERVAHLAEHDSLTGLPNRLLFNDRLGQSIARVSREGRQLAVLFLDLDGFKHINDSLGHPIGDKLLQSVAKRLLECVRSPDTVSRQGGDEFIVLLQDMEHDEDAAIAARRILRAVAESHAVERHELHITASIGVSVYPGDGLDAETLVKNADTAMYHAKEAGRHNYRFFKQEMNVKAVERQSIEENLRRALERREFTLHYQPKIDLRTGTITGAEALLRWTHRTRGNIPPAQFIPVAEDSGLIIPIGAWVMREACAQAKAWADAGLPAVTMAVNVSALQFRKDAFLDEISATLMETGLDPRLLELEVTESILMERAELTVSILQTMREKGVLVSVDDFGTGYSSLSYLRKLPLDALKIDQSFVRQMTTHPGDTTIVSAIISMGKSLKLRVIAEGVETAEELAFLKTQDCDEAQGFFFSQAVPAAEFARLLEAQPY